MLTSKSLSKYLFYHLVPIGLTPSHKVKALGILDEALNEKISLTKTLQFEGRI
jgi:hypothetical protein